MIPILSSIVGRIVLGAAAALGALRYGAGLYAWREANRLETPAYTVVRRLADGVEIRKYDRYVVAETTVSKEGFRESTGDGFRKCASYIFGKNKPRGGGSGVFGDIFGDMLGDQNGGGGNNGNGGEKMAMTAPVRVSGRSQSNRGEKMAMTSPVRTIGGGGSRGSGSGSSSSAAAGKTKVSFVMGTKYDLKTAPRPIDRDVVLREVPSHFLAVRKFAGPPPKDDRVRKERARIEKALTEASIRPIADGDGSDTMVYGYHDPFLTPNCLRRNEVAVMVDPATV